MITISLEVINFRWHQSIQPKLRDLNLRLAVFGRAVSYNISQIGIMMGVPEGAPVFYNKI